MAEREKVMENKVLKRFLVMAIVFVITFSNCGLTLQALATSEGISVFGFSLFGKDRISYKAYFLDENGKETDEMSADVNSEMTLVLELEPKEVGYLKDGTILAVTEEGEANFEFKEILNLSAENGEKEGESLEQTVQLQETLLKTEQVVNAELPEVELGAPTNNSNTVADANNVVENNTVENNVVSEKVENVTKENSVTNTTATESATNTVQNEVSKEPVVAEEQNTVTEESSVPETSMPEDVLVDEEIVYQEEVKENEEAVILPSSAKINSANEIAISNIVEPTKIYVKLAYKAGETLKVSDLYKEASLELTGRYINENLEEVEVSASDKITTEWTYSKDILVSSEITKVSPFEVEGTKGTLVESRIVVNRDCIEENYLPLKETVIELEAPQINGKLPKALDVSAVKLKATTGEEINEITFSSDNWNYDLNNNTITIKVENSNAVLTSGEDIYIITYRYDEYVESEEITVNVKGKITAEEYSGKENNKIVKEFSDEKNTIVNIGELITYSIGTTEDLISKAKINANYNSVEAVYETEYTSTVSINILTNDVLREFTLKDIKDFYVDKTNIELEATDVKYKSVKFRYDEIAEILNQGGTIEIKAATGELLYTLNNELIKSQDNCEIVLNGDVRGVEISVKDIKANGTITIDFVKSIGKCAYEKAVFNNFDKIESRIKAEVKYGTSDEIIELTPLKTEKYFEKSYTRAEISMNKDALSTILDNDNVEIKIELNNNAENSDLYINPEFEVVFPSYVQDVEVKSVNLLYEEGLTVKNIGLFKDSNNVQRMKIQLEGVQRNFSSSDITNGTNIIVNTKIVVDDYTPRKEDQLKMYYFNQGVTNYQSQTEWKISTPVPNEIIKTTNGFDVEVFEFQAPSGFVTANGIENYDGLGSTIQTIKQGEVTAKAEMGEIPRVVTMTLAALNNTGNKCTDVVMLGRIPNTEATDVITGAKLGTTTNTQLVSEIMQDSNNAIGCNIYYSYNPNATQRLSDLDNGWTKTPEDLSQVKSFLIMPTGVVEAGTAFKFTYNFQVPANLPYEAEMYGSFGAYYNNYSDVAIVYESTKADLVGLVTDIGPKVEASISVDIGDGANALEGRILDYTLTLTNSGSILAKGINVTIPRPEYGTFTEFKLTGASEGAGGTSSGDEAAYYDFQNEFGDKRTFTVDELNPGEVKEFKFSVRLGTPLTGEPSKTNEEEHVHEEENVENTEVVDERTELEKLQEKLYLHDNKIRVQGLITVDNLTIESETNMVTNTIVKARMLGDVMADYLYGIHVGESYPYYYQLTNISGDTLKDFEITCKIPKELKCNKVEISNLDEDKYEVQFDETKSLITIKIYELENNKNFLLTVNVSAVSGGTGDIYPEMKFVYSDGVKENGPKLPSKIIGGIVSVELSGQTISSTVLETEKVEYAFTIKNSGTYNANEITGKLELSENIENVNAYSEEKGVQRSLNPIGNTINLYFTNLAENETIKIFVEGTAKRLSDTNNNKIKNNMVVNYSGVEIANIETNEIMIKENPNLSKEQENIDNSETNTEQGSNGENATEPPADNSNTNLNNNASNNSNNNTNDNINNNNSNANSNDDNKTNTENNSNNEASTITYAISGNIWLDENKDGNKNEGEKALSSVEIQLLKNGKVVKVTQSSVNGKYTFTDVANGVYSLNFVYDGEKYVATTYKAQGVNENTNSDAMQMTDGHALSNNILIENGNVDNLNLGLQYKDTLDFTIKKMITSAKVVTKKGETVYDFDNLELAKFEIAAKELKNAKVQLTYRIDITNEGNTEGQVTQLVDYMPKDTTLLEENNGAWYLGKDGNAYNDSLKDENIMPGATKTIEIKLMREMTEENTGVLENKISINSTYNKATVKENEENNIATQETIISVKTGYTVQITIFIVLILGISIISNLIITKKIKIDLKNFKINRIYK